MNRVNVLDKVQSEYSHYGSDGTCKKCVDINYLTSEELGNLTFFGYKCRYCNTINRVSLAEGELKKQE